MPSIGPFKPVAFRHFIEVEKVSYQEITPEIWLEFIEAMYNWINDNGFKPIRNNSKLPMKVWFNRAKETLDMVDAMGLSFYTKYVDSESKYRELFDEETNAGEVA